MYVCMCIMDIYSGSQMPPKCEITSFRSHLIVVKSDPTLSSIFHLPSVLTDLAIGREESVML